jgi:transposase
MILLTDEQWERIRKHFPEEHIPDGRPGRKPILTHDVLEVVLWAGRRSVQPSAEKA